MSKPIKLMAATPEDFQRFYGFPPARTVQAVAMHRGDSIIGFAGLYLGRGCFVLFANLGEELRRSPRTILRAHRWLMAIAQRAGLPVHALADEGVESSERFLEHMGFRRILGREFRWPN